MLIRKELLDKKKTQNLQDYFPDEAAVFFDIETTGLSWRNSHLYLIGALAKEKDGWTVCQWFLDKPGEEKMLLAAFYAYLRRFINAVPPQIRLFGESESDACQGGDRDAVGPSGRPAGPVLVHFNGNMFDLPYVRHKCEFYGLPDPFDGFRSLDIYRKVRPYQKMLGLTSLRQKSIEAWMGIRRKDEKSGGELIGVYQDYLRTGSGRLLDLLFLHNHDDVIGMNELLPILSIPELFEKKPMLFSDGDPAAPAGINSVPAMRASVRMPVSAGNEASSHAEKLILEIRPAHRLPEAFLRRCLPMADPLCTLGLSPDAPLFLDPEGTGYKIQAAGSDTLYLCVPVVHTVLKHFFNDYRNYYYLPDEDQAIHKDIAVYVDPSHREKARRETCYQRHEGDFLPDPEELFSPSFSASWQSKPAWFLPGEEWENNLENLSAYAHELLQLFVPRKNRRKR